MALTLYLKGKKRKWGKFPHLILCTGKESNKMQCSRTVLSQTPLSKFHTQSWGRKNRSYSTELWVFSQRWSVGTQRIQRQSALPWYLLEVERKLKRKKQLNLGLVFFLTATICHILHIHWLAEEKKARQNRRKKTENILFYFYFQEKCKHGGGDVPPFIAYKVMVCVNALGRMRKAGPTLKQKPTLY